MQSVAKLQVMLDGLQPSHRYWRMIWINNLGFLKDNWAALQQKALKCHKQCLFQKVLVPKGSCRVIFQQAWRSTNC